MAAADRAGDAAAQDRAQLPAQAFEAGDAVEVHDGVAVDAHEAVGIEALLGRL